jgi:capsular exopolysaccharide synthesis family protein
MSAGDSNGSLGDKSPADAGLPVEPIRGSRILARPDVLSLDDADNVAPALSARNPITEVLHALRRHWFRASLAGAVLGTLAAIGVWLGVPRLYTATVYLRMASGSSNILDLNKSGDGAALFDLYKRTQKQLVRSPAVLNSALQRKEVLNLPLVTQQVDQLGWLQKIVTVTFPDDAEIMNVSVRCEDQRTAEILVEAVVEVYRREVVDADRDEKMRRITSLIKAETETKDDLKQKRADLRRLADALGTTDSETLTLAQKNTLEEYSVFSKQLNQVEWELKQRQLARQLGDRKGAAAAGTEVPVSEAEVEMAASVDPIISIAKNHIENRQVQIDEARKVEYGAKEAETLRNIQAGIDRAHKRIEDRKTQLRKDIGFRKKAAEQSGASSIAMLESQQKDLSTKVQNLRKEAEKFGRSSVDVELKRAEIKALDFLCDRIQRELREANIEAQSLKARVVKLSPAYTPVNDDLSRRVTFSASVGAFGFLAGCGLVVLWDLRRRRLNTLFEVADGLRLPVLGAVPHVTRNKGRNLSHMLAEAIDGIAARLVFAPVGESPQVVLITSASAGEGKTTVALNLATSFAHMGRRTVLVDFDLRRPRLHTMFEVDQSPGISEILAGQAEPLGPVLATSTENLFLLPAGAWAQRRLSASTDEMVGRIVADLREAFVHVVIDAPPVLPVVETRVIARHTDGVVISLLRDISEIPKVQSACELLRSFNIRILGAVMVGAPGEIYYARANAEIPEQATESA